MAFTVNRSQYLGVAVEKETAEGTDPTPTGGTDDLICYTNANPGEQTADRIQLQPFTATFTKPQGLIGARLGEINLEFLMMPNGTPGTLENGTRSIAALFMAAGCVETNPAGTPSTLVYSPATVSQLTTFSGTSPRSGSCTVYADHNGVLHKYTGVWGNMVVVGAPGAGLVCQFSGLGNYVAPTVGTVSGWTGGTNRATAFNGVACTIRRSGGTPYTVVGKEFRHDFGCAIDRITDFNNSTGLKGLLFGDRKPTLSMTIGLDNDGSAAITYAQFYSDWVGRVQHEVGWTHNNIVFNAPKLDIVNVRKGVDARHRTLRIDYEIVNTTAEADFSYVVS